MIEDSPETPVDMALQYAVSVSNCFMNVNGFTPAQLAIGQNIKLPSTSHDKLPTLEGVTSSPTIASHLNALAAAKKAFMQAEISSKICKALKHPVRQNADVVYKQGDCVFYKMDDDKRRHGEAFVIGLEEKNVMVKHGSVIRGVYSCHLQMVNSLGKAEADDSNTTTSSNITQENIV